MLRFGRYSSSQTGAPNYAVWTHGLWMGDHQVVPSERATGHSPCWRPARPERCLFGFSPVSVRRATWSNGSSTRSSNVGVLRPIRQSSRPTIWLSSNSHQFEFGCVLPGPRLSNGRGFEVVEALFAPCAPSRHHETYWWARPRFSQRAPNCFASRASAISIQECDKTTRRANQSKVCPALRAKIFRLTRRANQK